MSELLPCPFCGRTPDVFPSGDGSGTMIECTTPGCVNPHTSWYGSNVAQSRWNTRAKASQPAQGVATAHEQPVGLTAAVDAAMVEMQNIHPPLKISECERLIKAAMATKRESGNLATPKAEPAEEQKAGELVEVTRRGGTLTVKKPSKAALAELPQQPDSFQDRVRPWMTACFGPAIAADAVERNHRFLEESLELVQACGASREECYQLVDYVYGRPVGERGQEVGGVRVTLAALCLANGIIEDHEAEKELARIWTKIEMIRAKQAAKPRGSVLPISPSYAEEPPK